MRDETYRLHERNGVKWLTFPALEAYPELVHGFTTRHGGVSRGEKASLNFGKGPDETWENILENYRILSEALSEEAGAPGLVDREHMVRTDQTHSANIRTVTEADLGKGILRDRDYTDIDGLITNRRGITLITSHGDCNALYFYDPVGKAIGLAHSGWRGTLAEIGAEMVRHMSAEFGTQPENLIVGIGPALCQDCFEVEADVAELFYAKDAGWRKYAYRRKQGEAEKHYINLKAIVRETVQRAGVQAENMHDMSLCTRCGLGEDLFFSYRRQKGRNGNMAAVLMLRPELK